MKSFFGIALVASLALLAGCGEERQAKSRVEAAQLKLDGAKQDRRKALDHVTSLYGQLTDTYRTISATNARQAWDQVARSGAAGTGELLRAASSAMSDPLRGQRENDERERALLIRKSVKSELASAEADIPKREKAVEEAQAELNEATNALKKIQNGQ